MTSFSWKPIIQAPTEERRRRRRRRHSLYEFTGGQLVLIMDTSWYICSLMWLNPLIIVSLGGGTLQVNLSITTATSSAVKVSLELKFSLKLKNLRGPTISTRASSNRIDLGKKLDRNHSLNGLNFGGFLWIFNDFSVNWGWERTCSRSGQNPWG